MTPSMLASLPSVQRQHLVSEFAGLKQSCPEGVFVSLTPGDPTLWSAVLFVRNGPYAPAVLRFHIHFPHKYPAQPPVVTFSTDMFHPLITPLTTYMYTTDIQNNGTVSAADGERLPPGGFSLRHGFPNWFSRGSQRATAAAAAASAAAEGSPHGDTATPQLTGHARLITPEQAPAGPAASYASTDAVHTSAYDVLKYVRSAFGDEDVLDSIPLEAAGNPGAWHAWRTHRRVQGKVFPEDQASTTGGGEEQQASAGQVPASSSTSQAPRQPGEWNWEGVWEDRVKKGINASLSEPVLYGGTAALPDDLIHFLPLEQAEVDAVKENIRRTLGETTP